MSAHQSSVLASAAPVEKESYPPRAYAWYAVGVLTVAYMFSFIDRQILNLLVGPIRRDLGISDTKMSLLMGFSFAVHRPRSSEARIRDLEQFVWYYNHQRPHLSLHGLTPVERCKAYFQHFQM